MVKGRLVPGCTMQTPNIPLRDFAAEDLAAIQAGTPVRIWSSVLDCWMWWCRDEDAKRRLERQGATLPAYTLSELKVLRGWPATDLRNAHALKAELGATISESGTWKRKSPRDYLSGARKALEAKA